MATKVVTLDRDSHKAYSDFKKALRTGDVETVRRLMTEASNRTKIQEKHNSMTLKEVQYNVVFLRSIQFGRLKEVGVMLRAGVDKAYINDLSDEQPIGHLQCAIRIKNPTTRWKMVKLLVEHGLGLRRSSPTPCLYKQSCFLEAIYQGDCRIVKYLVENAGAKLDYLHRTCMRQFVWWAPIHVAVMRLEKEACAKMVKQLVELGADINIMSSVPPGHTCLNAVQSRETDRCEVTKMLLDAGAQLNLELDPAIIPADAPYMLPLASAAHRGDCELLKLMIDAGAEVNPSRLKSSALYWAVKRRKKDAVQLLLEHGADVDAKADDGNSIICAAADDYERGEGMCSVEDYIEVLKIILSRCTDKNPTAVEDYVPFYYALRDGTLDAVLLFLENGVQLNNCGIKFPLHEAIWNRRNCATEILEYLLKSRLFDVDMINEKGETPLSKAARARELNCLKLFVKWGADANTDSKLTIEELGLSVLHSDIYHSVYVFDDIADILLSGGATIDLNRLKNRLKENHLYRGDQSSAVITYFIKLMILLRSKGLHIDVDTEKLLMGAIPNSSEIVSQCSAELEILKTLVFYGSLTYYDVLIGKDISRYTSNSQVMENFESLKVKESYPLYGSLIDCRHFLACVRWQVIQEAIKNLKKLLKLRFCHGILYEIMSKLRMKDLRNLCYVFN